MADVNSAPQNGPVLSYSVTNDRGWNDPPSFVFSPNTTTNRKRIDPRKRVAHNITSMNNGYNTSPGQSFQPIQTPPQPNMNHTMTPQQQPSQPPMNHAMTPQQPTMNHQMTPRQLPPQPAPPAATPPVINQQPPSNAFPTMYNQPPTQINSLNNGFQSMSLAPKENTLHHASSNPDLHHANYMQSTPVMHHSTSVPSHINQAGQNRIPGHAFGSLTPPSSNSNTPPLVQPRSGSATPPQAYIHNNQAQTNGRKMSAPTMPFLNSSIFSQHSTPTMLQSSHRKTDSPHPPSPSSMPVVNTNQQPSSLPPRISPMPPQPAVPEHLGANMYNRSHSNPEAHRRPSPVSMAPPTMGYYAQKSGGNSPKSMSPGNSGTSSPVPTSDANLLENDNESLSNTLNSLNNFKSRCSCQLTNKMSDDIGKKIQTFETAWRSGKLSAGAKNKMVQLGQALNSTDIQTADRLHKRLIQEHSGEVTSWVIGIKKLITVFQSIPQ